MKSTSTEDPKMETRVLMPSEFSLVVTARPLPPLDRLVPAEDCIKVCATRRLPAQTRYLPFSGTVRADNLPLLPYLPPMDVRSRYGGYDSVDEDGRRTCNWVRFLKVAPFYSHEVNLVGRRAGPRGDVVFEVVQEVQAGGELLAFLLPDMSGENSLLLPALTLIRSSLYRRTIDSIMAEAPLDLSRSLLTSPPPSSRAVAAATAALARDSDDASPSLSSPSPSSSPASSTSSTSSSFSPTSSSVFHVAQPQFGLSPRLPLSLAPQSPSALSSGSSSSLQNSAVSPPLSAPKRRERTMLPCSECGKAFDRPSLLKRHIRTHTGEKPHVCDVCGKGFSTSSSLNTHRRIHSGEKPHQCGVCGKRFTASSNLYYHKMTHVKEKPHKCSLCTRSFPTPGDLRSHMFVHNGQWPHKCSVCGKGFSKLTNLRNHALLHAEVKRAERSLPSAPATLASPPSTSGSDTPLTPPAAYSPPAYSTFPPSTILDTDTPPSSSTSHTPPICLDMSQSVSSAHAAHSESLPLPSTAHLASPPPSPPSPLPASYSPLPASPSPLPASPSPLPAPSSSPSDGTLASRPPSPPAPSELIPQKEDQSRPPDSPSAAASPTAAPSSASSPPSSPLPLPLPPPLPPPSSSHAKFSISYLRTSSIPSSSSSPLPSSLPSSLSSSFTVQHLIKPSSRRQEEPKITVEEEREKEETRREKRAETEEEEEEEEEEVIILSDETSDKVEINKQVVAR